MLGFKVHSLCLVCLEILLSILACGKTSLNDSLFHLVQFHHFFFFVIVSFNDCPSTFNFEFEKNYWREQKFNVRKCLLSYCLTKLLLLKCIKMYLIAMPKQVKYLINSLKFKKNMLNFQITVFFNKIDGIDQFNLNKSVILWYWQFFTLFHTVHRCHFSPTWNIPPAPSNTLMLGYPGSDETIQ